MERSPGFNCFKKLCDASLARRSGSPAMLKLRSTPSATGQWKLAGGKCRYLLGAVVFKDLKVGLAQTRDQLPVGVGDGGVDLNELNA
jgi:hypothetical protein